MTPLPYQILLPIAVTMATAVVCFVGGRILNKPAIWGLWSLMGLLVAGAALVPASRSEWSAHPAAEVDASQNETSAEAATSAVRQSSSPQFDVVWDRFSVALAWASLAVGFLVVMTGLASQRTNRRTADWHGMLLLSVSGLMLAGLADDMIALFLALELACLPISVLLWVEGRDESARGAAMSYALLHVVSSALLLLGLCFACGLAGSTNLGDLRLVLLSHESSVELQLAADADLVLGVASMVLIAAGLGFRLAVVPFHFGFSEIVAATTTTTATLLSVVPKLAAVAVFLRVLVIGLAGLEETGMLLALVLSGMTMVVCSALALRQTRLRLMLAYCVMAQGGFVLAALAVGFQDFARASQSPLPWDAFPGGIAAALLVLAADTLTTLGLYALLVYLARPGSDIEYPEQLSGLLRSQPVAAISAGILLLSLVGIPPLCGFWGRLNVLMAMVSTGGDSSGSLDSGPNVAFWLLALAAICALLATSAVALRLLVRICLDAQISRQRPEGGVGALATVVITAALCLGCGLWPRPMLDYLDDMQQALCEPRAVDSKQRPSGGAGGGRRSTTFLESDLNSVARSGKIPHVGPSR